MQALKDIIPLIFTASLFLLVLKVGLDATVSDLTSVLRSPGPLLRAILAVNIVVPVAGVLLVHVVPISFAAAAGVLLMGISPVPPLVPGKQLKVGGDKAYSYGLYAALALLSIITVPIWVAILDALFAPQISLPFSSVARNVAMSVLLPLALGLTIRRVAPKLAAAGVGILGKLAMIALVVAAIPVLIGVWPALTDLAGDGTLIVMVLMAAIALAAGHLLGGPARSDRAALAVTAATRHPGIALMIANANTDDARVRAAILGFLLVGLFAGLPYQFWLKRRASAGEASSQPRGAP